MSEFISGLITGAFGVVGVAICLFAYASLRLGRAADDLHEQYDPEARP